MKRKIPIITRTLIFLLIFSGIALCSCLFFIGYRAFSARFRAQYETSIQNIAKAARQCLNPDDFQRYIAEKVPDEKYNFVLQILQDFVDKFDLNMIYVSIVAPPDYKHITYIYNPVKQDGKWKSFPLGFEEDYINESYSATTKRVFENKELIVRHSLKTRSGSHITAQVPVFDSAGKVIAVLGVQKNIQEFVDSRITYIRTVVIFEIIFGIIFILFFITYFNKRFIRPILLVTREIDRFSSLGGNPNEALLSVGKQDEIGILAHSLHQMEIDLNRNIAELTRVTAEKERIGTELNLAAKIQQDMLPKGYPPYPKRSDFDIFATMTPAKEVGGDFFDYLLPDSDKLVFVVGDVSGKGVGAAMFMGKCKILVDFFVMLGLSPKEIFERTNNKLCEGNESGLFVTCWLGIYRFSTGELTFVNAGHPYPVLLSGEKIEFIQRKPNLVMGAMDGIKYTEHKINLKKDDRLFVYTDGVSEANNTKDDLFGDARLLDALKGTQNLSVPDTLKKVRAAVDAFAGGAEQFDDITMLEFVLKE